MFPLFQAHGHFSDRALAHAIDQDTCRRIRQNGLANRVRPVVVVGKPAQAGLDPTHDDRNAGKEGVNLVGVNDQSPVRPATDAPGGIDIRVAAS